MRHLTTLFATITTLILSAPALFAADEAHDAAAAGHAAASASPFAGTIYQAIATAIIFVLLLTILYKMAWGPILQGLQDREGRIKSDLEEAESAARKANATLAEYEKKLADAAAEAQRQIEQARADAQKVAGQIRAEAENDIKNQRQRAVREIESAKQQAITDLYDQAASLSTQIAGRILQRELNESDHKALVSESLAELTDGSKG